MTDARANLWIDATGEAHRTAGPEPRIVSLVPSLTELLFDLGLGASVVGRTSFCVRPKDAVAAVPALGGPKRVDMKRLLALRPTHAILNVDENPRSMAEELAAAGVEVVVTHPIAPEDNVALYRLVGGVFDRASEAEALCARFDAALREMREAAAGWPARHVLYLIWKKPWMTVAPDTYIARTLALANWHTVPDPAAARYPEVTVDSELLGSVDLVLFSSEPYPFKPADLDAFRAEHGVGQHPRLALVDAEDVSWYGSRAIDGLRNFRRWAEPLSRCGEG